MRSAAIVRAAPPNATQISIQCRLQETPHCDRERRTEQSQQRRTMIKKVKGGYKVLAEKTRKNLGGPYKTKAQAEKRLRQVEYFKHKKG
jgi:hypothetical protein